MNSERPIFWGAAAVVLIAAAGLYYYYYGRPAKVLPPPAAAPVAAAPATPPAVPAIQHPVPQAAAGDAAAPLLPPLNGSDPALQDAFSGLIGQAAVTKFLIPDALVRHIVVTIDNLPRTKTAVELRPLKPTPGRVTVSGDGAMVTLNPASYARYTPFVQLVQSTDARQLVDLYFRFYPLFQQAYEDLGYPTQYFNDRVVQVIDDLLATPDVKDPIALVQPKVFYQYADPKLEALSAGQKTLIRMGSANAAIIKAKLRELRAVLVAHK